MLPDAIQTIRRFVTVLDDLSIDYYIGGSMASIAYGKARATRDVDFVLTVMQEDGRRLVERLRPRFYIDETAVERAISTGDCFNALDLDTVFQADVFTPLATPWIREQFERRRLGLLGSEESGVQVYLCSAEDVVLNKLEWFRLGNEVSEVQWQDALGVLAVQGSMLDRVYMNKWADELSLTELLSRAYASLEGSGG
jgi:hypothetical protein